MPGTGGVCAACGHVLGAGAAFCGGCGAPQLVACPDCGRSNPRANRFCEGCGRRLESDAEPPVHDREGERRYLTVMFCDLVGSTALSARLDPEDMRRVIRAYQEACRGIIAAHDGSVAQYLGDGILAYFGFPAAHEDDQIEAVRAAREICAAMEAVGRGLDLPDLQARVGLHTGLVVVGDLAPVGLSSADILAADVLAIGETPNIAARLQALASPGEVVVGAGTAAAVRGYFVLESLGTPELKGVARPLEAFRVLGETSATSRLDARGGLTPLIGRDSELAVLAAAAEAARASDGCVVLIEGEPGIGKSRLVLELVTRESSLGMRVAELRCSPRHTNSVLHPVIDLLVRWSGLADATDDVARLRCVERIVADAEVEADDAVPVVAHLLGVATLDHHPVVVADADQLRSRTLAVLIEMVLGSADAGGLLVVVEDVQWVDPTTLELVEAIAAAARERRVLLALTRRPGDHRAWALEPDAVIPLGRLDPASVEHMVSQLLGDDVADDLLRSQVLQRTDGVPLFIEELTRMLLDNADPSAADDSRDRAVPSTLRDLLMARVDGLGVGATVARLAATVGREAPYDFLRRLWSGSPADLDAGLDRLVESGLMQRHEQGTHITYVFKHALVQDVAYDTLLKSVRQGHHRTIATVLESSGDTIHQTSPETIAHHFTMAAEYERAVPYWLAAGDLALRRSAHREAIAHFTTGLDQLLRLPETPERDRLELDLLVRLGAPLMAIRGYGSVEVEDVYRRAQQLGDGLGDALPLYQALYGMFRMHLLRAEYAVSGEIAVRLLALADATPGRSLTVSAHRALGSTLVYQGRLSEALLELDASVAADDPPAWSDESFVNEINDVADAAITSRSYAAWVHWLQGDRASARTARDTARSQARELGHPFTISLADCFGLWLLQFEQEVDGLLRASTKALDFAREQGFTFWLGWAGVLHGWARAQSGELQEGMAEIQRGLVDWQATGSRTGLSYFLCLLGDVQRLAGQLSDATDTLREARWFAHEHDEGFWLPEIVRAQAMVAADSGDDDAAADLLDLARGLAAEAGSWALAARIDATIAGAATDLTDAGAATRSSDPLSVDPNP